MFDYQLAKQDHFNKACRQFAQENNLEQISELVGMRPQVLRNKLNPEQPHKLSCEELLQLTDITESPRLLDGLLAQLSCLPSVPMNEATHDNIPICTLSATAAIGSIAAESINLRGMSREKRNNIIDKANEAIRDLSMIMIAVDSRFNSSPALAATVDIVSSFAPNLF